MIQRAYVSIFSVIVLWHPSRYCTIPRKHHSDENCPSWYLTPAKIPIIHEICWTCSIAYQNGTYLYKMRCYSTEITRNWSSLCFGTIIHMRMYTNSPANHTKVPRINSILMIIGSIERYSPIPPQTPPIQRSFVDRYNFFASILHSMGRIREKSIWHLRRIRLFHPFPVSIPLKRSGFAEKNRTKWYHREEFLPGINYIMLHPGIFSFFCSVFEEILPWIPACLK